MNKDQLKQLENDLWAAADNLRANSDLKSSEYATPVLGLIFLKFADNNYRRYEKVIQSEYQKLQGSRREKPISEIAIAQCGFYLPDIARYDYLLNLPEQENVAKKIKEAMEAIESHKPELEGVLPKDEYFPLTRTDKTIPSQLLKTFSNIPRDAKGDMLGQIFHEKVEPVFRKIKILCQQNNQLSDIRNSLLPRLISGKLSVENLDIQFPPSML